jgi:fused signal recognition particle receptor
VRLHRGQHRVGSRSVCTLPSGTAASIAATSVCSAAVSLSIVVSKLSDSRSDITAMPWSPSVPETSTTSPGRALAPPIWRPGGTTPTPVVLMKTPSPLPRSTTLVSPVTMGTPASRAAAAIESTMRLRSASGKPSSRMKLAARYSGVAPSMATSLTVPCTDRQPMSPPGKNSGEITCASVAITSR